MKKTREERAILRSGDPTKIVALAHRSPENAAILVDCVTALHVLDARGGAPLMRSLVEHGSSSVRRAAIAGLMKFADPDDLPLLSAAVSDTDHATRVWAVGGLGRLPDGEAKRLALDRAIKSPDSEVARRAVRRLGQDKTADASRLLLSHLTDQRVGVRWLTRAVLSGRDDATLSDLPKSERRRIRLAGGIPATPSEFVP